MTIVERRLVHDLPAVAAEQRAEVPEPLLLPAGPLDVASAQQLCQQVRRIELTPTALSHVLRGIRLLLPQLEVLPGAGWQERWDLFEALADERDWRATVDAGAGSAARGNLSAGVGALITVNAFRPSYDWMLGGNLQCYSRLSSHRDPSGTQAVLAQLQKGTVAPTAVAQAIATLGQIQAHTGKNIRQLSADDLLRVPPRTADQTRRRGLNIAWRALHDLGWLDHPSQSYPHHARRSGQRTTEQLVDRYGVTGPTRDVLVEYLRQRSAALDYSSLVGLAGKLVAQFWADITRHNPEVTSFALERSVADAWKARARTKPDGTPRQDWHSLLFAVRAFYLDLSQWALHDSYWAPWVAPSPITAAETKGFTKQRKKQVAASQQRTRELAPVLPRLVAAADRERQVTAAHLAAARAAGPGAALELDGAEWEIVQATPKSPIRARRNGEERNLSDEEDSAFWSWAVVETLRHSGIRLEELLELTHIAFQPYTLPATGETIPLLHIVPSKTDEERLLVAGPELVHVLAQVIKRVRGDATALPLTQRWDGHERVLSNPLPHLFVRRYGAELRVVSPTTVLTLMSRLADRAGIAVAGRSVRFTPHDLRRVFATEALASGLPPHIVQVLMGHKNIATTQIYAAIYPADIIRHHRAFISRRRGTRPSEEYRQPTANEWREFEEHFTKRKVSLGSCARAYGTNCHHEHACVRCALLHPDPAQAGRLSEIAENLRERIAEAHENGWVGEAEGLEVSLHGAETKLEQMRQHLARSSGPVALGLPTVR